MEQNSKEWLALRGKKIGASDSNIIMGVSEHKTVRELWTQKRNYLLGNLEAIEKEDEKKNTFITDRGHKIEPKIRAMMELEYDVELPAQIVLCEDPNYDFMMASLDGYGISEASRLAYVLECKYVGQEDYLKVKNGILLPQYKPQVMHQLFLTKADYCIFAVACLNNEDLDEKGKPKLKYAHILVKLDMDYIKKELMPKLVWFWNCVVDGTDVGLCYDDVLEDNSEELSDSLTRYAALLKDQEELNERVEKLKKEIFKMAKHDKVICNGIKIYTVRTKGKTSVVCDYEGFLKELDKTLPDRFKTVKESKGSVSYHIKFPKSEESKSAEEMIVKGAHLPESEVKPKRKRRTKAEMQKEKENESQN